MAEPLNRTSSGDAADQDLLELNARAFRFKGKGRWRPLYLAFIHRLSPGSVVELGAGDPAFLEAIAGSVKRFALDGNAELAASYEKTGIEFFHIDLDRGTLPAVLAGCDVAVCSDVFEHLVYPERSLQGIAQCLGPNGILFSHVPNEFRLFPVLGILLGLRESVLFHKGRGCREWNNPHLRRFTDRGYRAFLETRFRYNLNLTPWGYRTPARVLHTLRLPVPYFLQGGPTYVSTNNSTVYAKLEELARAIPNRSTHKKSQ
jgi:SAM-dependent methyltransferase